MKENNLGTIIAELRKMKGLTQHELGMIVGVGDRAVSKWERGITHPDISMLSDIAKALDVKTSYLVDSLNNNNIKSSNAKKIAKKKEKNNLPELIYKATGLAMAVGVIVLNALDKLEVKSAINLLGIGLFATCLSLFKKNN